jgi:hypothetical protein
MKTHAERLQAIFQELPDLRASVDAGTLRVWVDDDGMHISLLSKRSYVSKRAKHVHIEDDQHDEIESRAKELHDLIQKHPYLADAIAARWAKVRIQEDGNLGIDFMNGRDVRLNTFGDGFGEVGKALRTKEKIMDGKKEFGDLIQKHTPLARAIADGFVTVVAYDDGDLRLRCQNGVPATLSEFDEAVSNVAKLAAGLSESEVRGRWLQAIDAVRLEKLHRSIPSQPILSNAGF